jgi:type I restriction-modification system DNA methylase subunit
MGKTFDEGKEEVARLCKYFHTNQDEFHAQNEAQTRQQLIDPLFEALGWDVRNAERHAPQYAEVVTEKSQDDEGPRKAPDYTFRVGNLPKFYVEAKRGSINIGKDSAAAFQLRRYGWNPPRLVLSLLTNFKELGVYDCTVRPHQSDKASQSRISLYKFHEYPDHWQEIWDVFSREAVWSGAFDNYANSKRKKGTSEFDDEFLKEIEGWREALAHNIALRNKDISHEDLNAAVQLTIDRIVFLRMAEDQGLEPYQQLLSLCEHPDIFTRFVRKLCLRADEKYNAGLFHFEKETGVSEAPDCITPKLTVDDKALKPILQSLYFEHGSPYDFRRMPVEILGTIYERFLGKVIRLTTSHQARIEEKPEVRKAGGVYYTPEYIVAYIVKHTVGQQIEGRSPAQLAGSKSKPPFRVLDMACGSGSFLLGAYQYLLQHCLEWYVANGPEEYPKAVFKDARNGEWRLTIAEKKHVLTRHIFGVDIDQQAVEVTKLSLLLKVLEGETDQTISRQQQLFHDRALPNLADNIKCGNSLIGSDYLSGKLTFNSEEGIKPFDWEAEFPEAFKARGFDAVVGNPPYIDSEWMSSYLKSTREYCVSRYTAASGNWDIFCVFSEKALQLCRPGGVASFIVPNKIGSAEYASGIRRVLTIENHLLSIRDYSHVPVFPIAVYPIIFVAAKERPQIEQSNVLYERMSVQSKGPALCTESRNLPYLHYFAQPDTPWEIFSGTGNESILTKMRAFPPLESVASVLGAATVAEAYEIQHLISEGRIECTSDIRVVNSGTIDRYHDLWAERPLRYLSKSYTYPIITKANAKRLPTKRRAQALAPKIIVAGMTKRLECVVDSIGCILAGKSTSIVLPQLDANYLTAVLNSKAVAFFYASVFGGNKLQGGYLRIGPPQLRRVPIPTLDSSCAKDESCHSQIVQLVATMLEWHRQLTVVRTASDKTLIQRRIDATDAEIDHLVYDLYGLTAEEVAIVEVTTK